MNLKDACRSIIKSHEEDILTPLTTSWGEQLDPGQVLPEYPRPQMVRNSYRNLNGLWHYAITGTDQLPAQFPGEILVPFSPECELSGVRRTLMPEEFLWYHTRLPLDRELTENRLAQGCRLLLHFGAVDYLTTVFLNGHAVLTHEGGYLPFEADITPYLLAQDNILIVRVQDFTHERSQARGKQTLKRGGIFYTAQSGIWQTVWMEWVPAASLRKLQFHTDFDSRQVSVQIEGLIFPSSPAESSCREQTLSLQVSFQGKELLTQTRTFLQTDASCRQSSDSPGKSFSTDFSFSVPESDFHPWSPESPALYDVRLQLSDDTVTSYFALRHYSIEKRIPGFRKGDQVPDAAAGKVSVPVFCLNHKPYFLMGVLDQGYWPDGLYTAPSEEALLYDIRTMKSLGFNMLRKHIKIECARWYYHCDRLGMIVCQDMVNGGSLYHMPFISYLPTLFPGLAAHIRDHHPILLSRRDKAARRQWEKECLETVDALSFFPSVAIWVPFNEGWGQFDTARITALIRQKDDTRLIDSASGWFDQGCGDFISIHNYFRPLTVSVKKWGERALFLSEYGGYACHIKDHSSVARVFGYRRYDSLKALADAYGELIEKSLLPLREQGLSGAVLTQLSDVEEEVNGILTYDRRVNKLSSFLRT